ncbi:putative diguanylate cyclase YcdT [Ruminiclostridium hungatei]|uniref:Putative diguanylate cyclase YcdT n=1 Tax=Ruminiclostridium hungatei TaxID=48256 RepID=A0A1V4SJ96_RUMHU|nr:GGDEF domain-containing protein [Ruminiclostridium hungatei]OPX43321.1 putative diguanylate cyclase YcdT [Ruminiclostridium hungatei]
MLTFNYIEINMIAMAILLIIYFNIRNKKESYLYDQKLFILILFFNGLILVFDTATWTLNMRSGEIPRLLNNISNTVYYILNPVPCMLWSVYADFQIFKDQNRIKKISRALSLPVIINGILALLSPKHGFLFFIDSNNIYHRGSLFIFLCLICYFYFAYTMLKLVRKKNRMDKRQYVALVSFAFPPFISAVFQILFFGISVIWICMAFSLLIVFINIQNNQLYTDYLTGLYNRRQLDNYLYQKIKNRMHAKYLAGVMIDVNSFKQINDIYGHTSGDNALVCVSDILKRSFRKNDFIARYGGDEFVIVVEIREQSELIGMINRLKENVEAFNDKKLIPYEISLSIGYDIYDTRSGVSIQKFYKHIDQLMYEDKRGRAVS